MRRLILWALILSAPLCAQNISSYSGNNTAACAGTPLPSYCTSAFAVLSTAVGNTGAQTVTVDPLPGNVSTLDIHSLLPAGTKVVVHSTDWFSSPGSGDHTQTKYNSNDANTVAAQDNDIVQRHVDGRVLDWYSQFNTVIEGAAQKIKADLNARCVGPQNCPLEFAIVEDQGAVTRTQGSRTGCATTDSTCLQTSILQDLCYMNGTYFGQNSYWKMNPTTHAWQTSTNPVVLFFPPSDTSGWNVALANIKSLVASNGWAATSCPAGQQGANGGLILIDTDTTSVSNSQYMGGGSWISPASWSSTNQFCIDGSNCASQNYHESLYSSCNANSSQACLGSAKKGFDDNNASWGTNRVVAQECGQTWATTLAKAANFSGSNLTLQVATWNDYEEGSEIETGIDSCYRLGSPTLSGTTVSWAVNTNDPTYAPLSPLNSTVHHFRIIACTTSDTNCLILNDVVPPSARSFSLNGANLSSGTWHIWVQMVGINSVQNQMSASAVTYQTVSGNTSACAPGQWCQVNPPSGTSFGKPFGTTNNGWFRPFFVHDTGFIYVPSVQDFEEGDGTYGVRCTGVGCPTGCTYGSRTAACNPDASGNAPVTSPFSSDWYFLVPSLQNGAPAPYSTTPLTLFSSAGQMQASQSAVHGNFAGSTNAYMANTGWNVNGPTHLVAPIGPTECGTPGPCSITVCWGTFVSAGGNNCNVASAAGFPPKGSVQVDDEVMDYSSCAAFDVNGAAVPSGCPNTTNTAAKWVLTIDNHCPQPSGTGLCVGQRQGAGFLPAYEHPAASASNNAYVYLVTPKSFNADGSVLYGARINLAGTCSQTNPLNCASQVGQLNLQYGDNTSAGEYDQITDGHPVGGSGDYDPSRGQIITTFGHFLELNGFMPYTDTLCIFAPANGPSDRCQPSDLGKSWKRVALAASGASPVGGQENDTIYVCGPFNASTNVCSWDFLFEFGGLNTGGFNGASPAGYIYCRHATANGIPACYSNNNPATGTYIQNKWIPICSAVSATNPTNSQWTACMGTRQAGAQNAATGYVGDGCTPAAGSPDGLCHGNPGIRDGARLVWDPDDNLVLIVGGRNSVNTPFLYWNSIVAWNPLTNDYCLSDTSQSGTVVAGIFEWNAQYSSARASGCSLSALAGSAPQATPEEYWPSTTWDNYPNLAKAYGAGKGVMVQFKSDEDGTTVVTGVTVTGGLYVYSPGQNKWALTPITGGSPAACALGCQAGKSLVHDDLRNVLFYFDPAGTGTSFDFWEISDSALAGSVVVQALTSSTIPVMSKDVSRTNAPVGFPKPLKDGDVVGSGQSQFGLNGPSLGQVLCTAYWPSGNCKAWWVDTELASYTANTPDSSITVTTTGAGNFGGSNLATAGNNCTGAATGFICINTGVAQFVVRDGTSGRGYDIFSKVTVGSKVLVDDSVSASDGLAIRGPAAVNSASTIPPSPAAPVAPGPAPSAVSCVGQSGCPTFARTYFVTWAYTSANSEGLPPMKPAQCATVVVNTVPICTATVPVGSGQVLSVPSPCTPAVNCPASASAWNLYIGPTTPLLALANPLKPIPLGTGWTEPLGCILTLRDGSTLTLPQLNCIGTSYGIAVAPGGATESGNTVTITTNAANTLALGDLVTITNVNQPGYDGTFTITAVNSGLNQFSYTNPVSGLANSGSGTVSISGGALNYTSGPQPWAVAGNDTCYLGSCSTSYTSANDLGSSCSVIENGPVKAVLKCTGSFADVAKTCPPGAADSLGNETPDCYLHWTRWMTFWKNHTYAWVVGELRNADLAPGDGATHPASDSKGYQSYEARVNSTLTGTLSYTFGGSATNSTGTLDGTHDALLYQAYTCLFEHVEMNGAAYGPAGADYYPPSFTYTSINASCPNTGGFDSGGSQSYIQEGYVVQANGSTTPVDSGDRTHLSGCWADLTDSTGSGVEIGTAYCGAAYNKELKLHALGGGSYGTVIGLSPDQTDPIATANMNPQGAMPYYLSWPQYQLDDMLWDFHNGAVVENDEFAAYQQKLIGIPPASDFNRADFFTEIYPMIPGGPSTTPNTFDYYMANVANVPGWFTTPATPQYIRWWGWRGTGEGNQNELWWAKVRNCYERGGDYASSCLYAHLGYWAFVSWGLPRADFTGGWRGQCVLGGSPPACNNLDVLGEPGDPGWNGSGINAGNLTGTYPMGNRWYGYRYWDDDDEHMHFFGMGDYCLLSHDLPVCDGALQAWNDMASNPNISKVARCFPGNEAKCYLFSRAIGQKISHAARAYTFLQSQAPVQTGQTCSQNPTQPLCVDAANALATGTAVVNNESPQTGIGWGFGTTLEGQNPVSGLDWDGSYADNTSTGDDSRCPDVLNQTCQNPQSGGNQPYGSRITSGFFTHMWMEGLLDAAEAFGPSWSDYNLAIDELTGAGWANLQEGLWVERGITTGGTGISPPAPVAANCNNGNNPIPETCYPGNPASGTVIWLHMEFYNSDKRFYNIHGVGNSNYFTLGIGPLITGNLSQNYTSTEGVNFTSQTAFNEYMRLRGSNHAEDESPEEESIIGLFMNPPLTSFTFDNVAGGSTPAAHWSTIGTFSCTGPSCSFGWTDPPNTVAVRVKTLSTLGGKTIQDAVRVDDITNPGSSTVFNGSTISCLNPITQRGPELDPNLLSLPIPASLYPGGKYWFGCFLDNPSSAPVTVGSITYPPVWPWFSSTEVPVTPTQTSLTWNGLNGSSSNIPGYNPANVNTFMVKALTTTTVAPPPTRSCQDSLSLTDAVARSITQAVSSGIAVFHCN